MSLALIKSGYSVPGQYKTEVVYDGVPAKSYFNPSSQAMIGILGKKFGTKEKDGYQRALPDLWRGSRDKSRGSS